ncbi:MAG: hypothetical protein AB1345_05805 [Chloroflexota bacterium]
MIKLLNHTGSTQWTDARGSKHRSIKSERVYTIIASALSGEYQLRSSHRQNLSGFRDGFFKIIGWLSLSILMLVVLSACSFNVAADVTLPPEASPASSPTHTPTPLPEVQVTPTTEALTTSEDLNQLVGVVGGQVTNGSGGELPSNLEVTLHGFDETQEVLTRTVTLQADGSYLFEDVDFVPGQVLFVTARYAGITFASALEMVGSETTTIELPLTIYDTSTDVAVLQTSRLHMFINFLTPDRLQVAELHMITNPSDRVIVPASDGQVVINFPLPEGASNLQIEGSGLEERFVFTDTGFGDTVPVRPGEGEYQILFVYELPYTRKINIFHPLQLPVGSVILLLQDVGVELKSSSLQPSGSWETEGEAYLVYKASNLTPESGMEFTLSGRPGTENVASFLSSNASTLAIGMGTLGLVLILLGVWFYRRSRFEDETQIEIGEQAEIPSVAQGEEAEALIESILALDDLYEEGKLSEDVYQKRRAELKGRLREVYHQQEAA